jgi:hypothetical protein
VTLTLPAEIGALDEFRVVQDAAGNLAAVFTSQAGQRELFVAFFDQAHGVWGNPVRLTDDRASERTLTLPALAPAGQAYVTATWGSPMAGEHTCYVVINVDRRVAELTWADNIASAWGAEPLDDLAATKDGGAQLTWTHGGRGVARYEVYRSTQPYCIPGDADAQKIADVAPPASGATSATPTRARSVHPPARTSTWW